MVQYCTYSNWSLVKDLLQIDSILKQWGQKLRYKVFPSSKQQRWEHEELLEKKGLYYQLYTAQHKKELEQAALLE